ncbi:uromodulin [Alligator mississippiensis]|uniref:Uromodulin n=1 Tax=Alligator mississippiensis TaxID=8496 RepID=A0A151N1G8_ALLMI|nr:uromodulin [Alligator mississippiensis]
MTGEKDSSRTSLSIFIMYAVSIFIALFIGGSKHIKLNMKDLFYLSLLLAGLQCYVSSETTLSSARCSDCHSNATCEENDGLRKCMCKDGFAGNGFNCSDVDECAFPGLNACPAGACVNTLGSYICQCPSGFLLSSEGGCRDIDECSTPNLNRCHSLAMCTNHNGSYSCSCPQGFAGDGYSCSAKNCTLISCDFGADCFTNDASRICADPCSNYNVLDNYWRSTSYGSGSNCDSNKVGWYRFIGRGGERMPEACVPTHRCNTDAPMWLYGSHPSSNAGIVTRTACAHWDNSCCYWSTAIQIKACPGGYFVYKFNGTPACSLTYCTDPTYVGNPCSCNADEECKLINGSWGCYCRKESNDTDIRSLQPELDCGTSQIKVSFSKCQLENAGFQNIIIYLKDDKCAGFEERNNRSLVSVVTPTQAGKCGTLLTKNATHATYSNTLYLADGIIVRDNEININFYCSYPLDMKLSLETAIEPMISSINISTGGTGMFTVQMALYRDQNYTSPFEGSKVVLSTDDMLYVGVMFDDGDTTQFVLLMESCYATPTKNATDLTKYFIIQDRCPNRQDSTIAVAENGVSTQGQFSLQMFKFVGNHNLVYLHCQIHLCDVSTGACKPSCSRRSHIGQQQDQSFALEVGPIARQGFEFLADSSFSLSFGLHAAWSVVVPGIMALALHVFP